MTLPLIYKGIIHFRSGARKQILFFGDLLVSASGHGVRGKDTKGITMKLAIIQAAVLAAMFLIAAAVSYHSGYVGGRVDGATETEVAK